MRPESQTCSRFFKHLVLGIEALEVECNLLLALCMSFLNALGGGFSTLGDMANFWETNGLSPLSVGSAVELCGF